MPDKPYAILLLADLSIRTFAEEDEWFHARYEYARARVAHQPYQYSENASHYVAYREL